MGGVAVIQPGLPHQQIEAFARTTVDHSGPVIGGLCIQIFIDGGAAFARFQQDVLIGLAVRVIGGEAVYQGKPRGCPFGGAIVGEFLCRSCTDLRVFICIFFIVTSAGNIHGFPIHGKHQIGIIVIESLPGDGPEDLEGDFLLPSIYCFLQRITMPLLDDLIAHGVLDAVGDRLTIIRDGIAPAIFLDCERTGGVVQRRIAIRHRILLGILLILNGIRHLLSPITFDPRIDSGFQPAVFQLLFTVAAVLRHREQVRQGVRQLHGGEVVQVAGDLVPALVCVITPSVLLADLMHLKRQLHRHVVKPGLEVGRLPHLGGVGGDGVRLEIGQGVAVVQVSIIGGAFRKAPVCQIVFFHDPFV